MTPTRRAAALLLLAVAACRQDPEPRATGPAEPAAAPLLRGADAVDSHSLARPEVARVTHVSLDLAVDFDARTIGGTATLDLQRRPDAREILLDSKGLAIEAVADQRGRPLDYRLGARDPNLGSPLAIALRPDTRRLAIRYHSAPDAAALQWLTPQQTAGRQQPFLFSQGEAIETRSWIPTQDSPSIRQSWDATIHVPAGMTAVMSAPRAAEPITQGGESVFSYRMPHSVAPYMIAIAVGDLAFRSLGPRSGVWAEPATLPAAARELGDTEKMIDAAEQLYGPYRWGRYDMIILPPAFPFGGMENPTLTFLTPTFLAGDRSLVSLVAHELAHSWSGNLATNATWNDFWLNEGLTTYAERRIVETLYGPKVAAQQVALGIDALNQAVKDAGGPTGADTRLHLDLKGRNPDDGLTDIAYEKGAAFMRMLEKAVGRPAFDAFLKGWFDRHAFQPVTSAIFLADLRQHLVKGDAALENRLQLDRWVYQPGIPANAVPADPQAFATVDRAVAAYARGGQPDLAAWRGWDTDERLRFLNRLPRKLPAARLAALDQGFGLDRIGNSEVRFAWLSLAVANRFDPALPSLEQFLTGQGRGKFVKPLFTALAKDPEWGLPIARRLYARARPGYHPLVTRDLDKLKLS
ncbi:M1 family peptidase [Sphingomonas ginkgonis]|uniref:Aminopeptidase N n=1 Tax=Sphingomonas ginkgonis TaxID=2315330 RepID=A0A429V7S3_9SPHN|nr:M1 family metallopeptidase [Sphingomonas ginkgonis]RST30003.1 M1 family peptidase [Sphingomonas ginkgonis]